MAVEGRVLHVLRTDHAGHVGGDLVQLGKSVDGLRSRGVDALAATIEAAPDDIDVVHLYNLQRPVELRRAQRAAARRWPNASVVLSPVWWPMQLRRMARSPDRAVATKALKTSAKTALSWPILRRALSTVDIVLPNSLAELHALQRSFRLGGAARRPGRWEVVPNGVDLTDWCEGRATPQERASTLARFGLDPDTSTLVACVARIEPVKNQAAVVRAVADLPRTGLLLIGPEGHRGYGASVRQEATRVGADRVVLTGGMSADEIGVVLRSVDVHVLASFRETPGLATLEAAAVGCEVVVTADGSAPEYLGDGAHVADPFEPTSITKAIVQARSDPRQPAARRRAARHTWEAATTALIEAYRRLPTGPTTDR